jgi:broad specificity phosphatase PhoE
MKTVYFVRHGESEGNAKDTYQDHTTALSEKGWQQAEYIANRCAKLPVEKIISSTFLRAKQTAEVIVKKVNVPIEHSDLLVEWNRPTEQRGLVRNGSEALAIDKAITDNWGVPGWRYSDEENFGELKERAERALELLASQKEDHVVAVTHGFFLRIILASALFGEELSPKEANILAGSLHTANTGLTILCYDEKKSVHRWWLWVWNDHAHLG